MHTTGDLIVTFACSMLSFCMVDMFDTLGTLFGACSVGGLLDEDGNVSRMEKARFLAPIAALIPGCATAAALIYVGILMIGNVKNIEWEDPAAVPAFLTMSMMPFTYNISYGIAFGLLSYIFLKLFTGKVREIKAGTWVIGALFTIMFFVSR